MDGVLHANDSYIYKYKTSVLAFCYMITFGEIAFT